MSLSLIFDTSPTSVDGIEFDAATLETHTKTAEVSNHPVEDGSTVSDHVSLQPYQLTIEGVFSNNPLPSQLLTKLTSSGLATIGPRRAEDAYNQLVNVYLKRTPVTVSTGLEEYESMVITGIATGRDATRGGSINVTVSLQQVNLVATTQVDVPATSPAVSKASKGKKPTKPTSAPVAEKNVEFQSAFAFIRGK